MRIEIILDGESFDLGMAPEMDKKILVQYISMLLQSMRSTEPGNSFVGNFVNLMIADSHKQVFNWIHR